MTILKYDSSRSEEYGPILNEFVVFLNAAIDGKIDPLLWIWHIRHLTESESVGDEGKGAVIRTALMQSGSPVMQIYASFSDLAQKRKRFDYPEVAK